MVSDLRIMTWNTDGLQQHKENLIVTLVDEKIDVCLISETHITTESYIKLREFVVYHTMHTNNCARVGRAVIIRE
jgi:exonuclease III